MRDPNDPSERLGYFVLLDCAEGGVPRIRDFRFARYATKGAEFSGAGRAESAPRLRPRRRTLSARRARVLAGYVRRPASESRERRWSTQPRRNRAFLVL